MHVWIIKNIVWNHLCSVAIMFTKIFGMLKLVQNCFLPQPDNHKNCHAAAILRLFRNSHHSFFFKIKMLVSAKALPTGYLKESAFTKYLWLSEQKPDMFALKLKFILLPQLIATLNNYACSLPPLANVDWSAFPKCFLPTM